MTILTSDLEFISRDNLSDQIIFSAIVLLLWYVTRGVAISLFHFQTRTLTNDFYMQEQKRIADIKRSDQEELKRLTDLRLNITAVHSSKAAILTRSV